MLFIIGVKLDKFWLKFKWKFGNFLTILEHLANAIVTFRKYKHSLYSCKYKSLYIKIRQIMENNQSVKTFTRFSKTMHGHDDGIKLIFQFYRPIKSWKIWSGAYKSIKTAKAKNDVYLNIQCEKFVWFFVAVPFQSKSTLYLISRYTRATILARYIKSTAQINFHAIHSRIFLCKKQKRKSINVVPIHNSTNWTYKNGGK